VQVASEFKDPASVFPVSLVKLESHRMSRILLIGATGADRTMQNQFLRCRGNAPGEKANHRFRREAAGDGREPGML
jgi:hypothetical protein